MAASSPEKIAALQAWSAKDYAQNAHFVPALGAPVLDLLDPKPGMRVLDLGCGDGVLTEKIAAAGAEVIGVDADEDLLAAAAKRGLTVMRKDGQALDFENEFDAVFTNAALHWMPKAAQVIQGVARALKPGGRFVGEFGGHGNVAAITTAMRAVAWRHGFDRNFATPWFFPTPAEYSALLAEGGFHVDQIGLIPRPTPLPGAMAGWLKTFGHFFYGPIGDAEAERTAIEETEALLAPSLRDQSGAWTADYVRLRFAAELKA